MVDSMPMAASMPCMGFADNNIPSWWHEISSDRRRRLLASTQDGQVITVNGRRLCNFASNDYLGLRNHPMVVAAAITALQSHGLGSGGSRYISGDDALFHAMEQALAKWKGAEACLLVGSGMLANIGVLQALATRHSDVFSDRLNHASLIDGCRLSGAKLHRYPHRDLTALENMLKKSSRDQRIIVSDGVFSMDGDEADTAALIKLTEAYDAWLVFDDAHGNGCIGNRGAGLTAESGICGHPRLIETGTFGKAFGGYGAFIVASSAIIEGLTQRMRTMIYSTALPPAMIAAMQVSLPLLQKDQLRQRLHGNIDYFLQCCQDLPLLSSRTPIQPLMMGDDSAAMQAAKALHDAGFFIPAIRPPTVAKGTARLRITLSANHTHAQINTLSEVLHS